MPRTATKRNARPDALRKGSVSRVGSAPVLTHLRNASVLLVLVRRALKAADDIEGASRLGLLSASAIDRTDTLRVLLDEMLRIAEAHR